jgi:hypothetical protein
MKIGKKHKGKENHKKHEDWVLKTQDLGITSTQLYQQTTAVTLLYYSPYMYLVCIYWANFFY